MRRATRSRGRRASIQSRTSRFATSDSPSVVAAAATARTGPAPLGPATVAATDPLSTVRPSDTASTTPRPTSAAASEIIPATHGGPAVR